MTVFENLLVAAMFGGGFAGGRGDRPLRRGARPHRSRRQARTSSPGRLTLLDRKRLELARALATRPQLLLLDEIAGGLTDDEAARAGRAHRRIKAAGTTIVWIEHVLHALLAVADRIVVIDFGAKLAEGRRRR